MLGLGEHGNGSSSALVSAREHKHYTVSYELGLVRRGVLVRLLSTAAILALENTSKRLFRSLFKTHTGLLEF
jgi:hypothetical protein